MIHSEIYIYKSISISVILLNVLFDVPAGDVFRYNEQKYIQLIAWEFIFVFMLIL